MNQSAQGHFALVYIDVKYDRLPVSGHPRLLSPKPAFA
jgi:hypothetical protein